MEQRTLTISFQVKDDLTSERSAEYRQVIIAALEDYYGGSKEAQKLVDKLLNDYYR